MCFLVQELHSWCLICKIYFLQNNDLDAKLLSIVRRIKQCEQKLYTKIPQSSGKTLKQKLYKYILISKYIKTNVYQLKFSNYPHHFIHTNSSLLHGSCLGSFRVRYTVDGRRALPLFS